MWTISINPGDIITGARNCFSTQFFYPTLIGKVLNYSLETNTISFSIAIIDGVIYTDPIKINGYDFVFNLATSEEITKFTELIKNYTTNKEKIYLDFIDLYEKADIETKYKIIDYILLQKLDK
jgi:hypothetical protein